MGLWVWEVMQPAQQLGVSLWTTTSVALEKKEKTASIHPLLFPLPSLRIKERKASKTSSLCGRGKKC